LSLEPFSYQLLESKIAQRPAEPYDHAKLLVCHRASETLSDVVFKDLCHFLREGDILVFNNSSVIPARLFGQRAGREEAGSKEVDVEILLLKQVDSLVWECLAKPLKRIRIDDVICFRDSSRLAVCSARVISKPSSDRIVLRFEVKDTTAFDQFLDKFGVMPIPLYIRSGMGDSKDRRDYQSIFARYNGSVAAPTASLHFTPDLLSKIRDMGCETKEITLHVGAASFLPIYRDSTSEGKKIREMQVPDSEFFDVDAELVDYLKGSKEKGRRVIAVGTTVVRALESAMIMSETEETDLFIKPGFEFKMVDALITNFHQPGTTHLLLVEAFMGRRMLERAYQQALDTNYRFLSYGDAMFIV